LDFTTETAGMHGFAHAIFIRFTSLPVSGTGRMKVRYWTDFNHQRKAITPEERFLRTIASTTLWRSAEFD
jgi:hypothetical protein